MNLYLQVTFLGDFFSVCFLKGKLNCVSSPQSDHDKVTLNISTVLDMWSCDGAIHCAKLQDTDHFFCSVSDFVCVCGTERHAIWCTFYNNKMRINEDCNMVALRILGVVCGSVCTLTQAMRMNKEQGFFRLSEECSLLLITSTDWERMTSVGQTKESLPPRKWSSVND